MARIPDDEIERIKREASLVRLVEGAGVRLVRHGATDLAGRCVLHPDDETPSLVVTPSKNLWHCFGCGKGGDPIQWVMETRGVGFREAAERLLEELGGGSTARTCPVRVGMSDEEMLSAVVDYYHETLLESGEARAYLERRGLWDEALVGRFRIGYANRSLGPLLPEKNRVAGSELRGQLQRVGLWRESGHEHLNGSIVIPIFDATGRVAQLYGRKINDNLRPGTPAHLYLPGPLRGIWNREALEEYDEVIVCEALFDAATFWRWGYRNVTTAYGVEGLTEEMIEALVASVARVLFAYDRDAAGDRAAERHAELLAAKGLECFRVEFPRGMDANAYAQKVTPGDSSLGALLRGASWMGKGARPAISVPATAVPTTAAPEPPVLAAEPLPPISRDVAPVASPVAPEPALSVEVRSEGEAVIVERADRCYRIRGLDRNTSYGQMKVQVLVTRGEALYSDALDLVLAKARREFSREAAVELGVEEPLVRHDLGRVLYALERLQDERIRAATAPKATEVALSDEERAEALELLRDRRVLDRILTDFARCGIVGEETNKLVGYLAAVSRKLAKPLGVLIQSSSAAGKTSLMEAILAFVPDEERVKYSAMTGQSLFYMSEQDLRHKVLALVEEEGAERASYALKLLQSEGELAIASTGKDPQSGRLVTHEYRVEGPVALLLTTTAAELDEELLNRCIVLTVDEDREQTRAIHRQQREHYTLEGLWAREDRAELRRLHQNAQRLLRPLGVVIPWARRLTFLDDKTRTRRDHEKYLTLIAVIAVLHQYQRDLKCDTKDGRVKHYLEAELSDIEVANRLASEVLGRSLDELAPQTRRLLLLVEGLVTAACERLATTREQYRFTRREVRQWTGWSYDQVRVHLDRLVELEYVLPHRGGRGQQFVYELLYDGAGKDGRPFLVGLIDVEALRAAGTVETLGGEEVEFGEALGAALGPFGSGLGSGRIERIANDDGAIGGEGGEESENAYQDEEALSYLYAGRSRGSAGEGSA